tara:strand:- start:8 stop:328 length:321 start_codon:yes stop_codon:yes gene_type:complete
MKKNKYFLFVFLILSNLHFLPLKSDQTFDLGKEIFLNKGNCASCHILYDAGSNGQIGPNLNEIKPSIARVISAVTNGIGVMPSYIGQLSTEEINAVSNYVSISSNK